MSKGESERKRERVAGHNIRFEAVLEAGKLIEERTAERDRVIGLSDWIKVRASRRIHTWTRKMGLL